MSDNWNPAAPDIGQSFHEADRGRGGQPRRSHSSDLVTAGQFESLENARAKPALEEHLRIGGPCETEVHHKLHNEREGEIRYVEDRLRSAADEMVRDFERSRNLERSRNFERTPAPEREREIKR